jgi:hypothetical protein
MDSNKHEPETDHSEPILEVARNLHQYTNVAVDDNKDDDARKLMKKSWCYIGKM